MQAPDIPDNEEARLDRLHGLQILDTPSEERFDRLTRLAARAFDVPVALVSLVDTRRQWFKSRVGLEATQTDRDISFCGHAILSDSALVVEDSSLDPRFSDNPLVVGEPRVAFYAGMPLDDGHGNKLGTVCLIDHQPRTFTERDRSLLADLARMVEDELTTAGYSAMRASLARSEGLYRAVVESLGEGLVVIDSDRRIVTFNDAAAEMVGFRPPIGDPMPKLGFVDRAHELVVPPKGPVAQTLLHGTSDAAILGLEQDDSSHRWFDVSSHPMLDDDGRVVMAVIALDDVTEKLEIDRVRDQLLAALAASNAQLDAYAGIVAHDLRAPVRTARLLADRLVAHLDDPQRAADLGNRLEACLERLEHLIAGLLDYAAVRDEAIAAEPVELAQIVDSIARDLTADIDRTGATVECVARATVFADRLLLTRLLSNLIENSLKYRHPDRAPTIEITQDHDQSDTIHITDNGLGIDPEYHDRVFKLFERLHPEHDIPGLGFGLAMCEQIAAMHDGTLAITTPAGHAGTRFSLSLPGVGGSSPPLPTR